MEKPRLVRPNEAALAERFTTNRVAVELHGYLWFTIPEHPSNLADRIWCRSLATGEEFYWYPEELEELEQPE